MVSNVPTTTEFEPHLVGDYREHPPRLRPLLALWDTSRDWLLWRLEGVTDDEWLWEPGPRAWTVRPVGERWQRDSGRDRDPTDTVRTIAWLAGHLGEAGLLRADWTTGSHSREPDAVEWPGTAAHGIDFLRTGLDAWRDALGQLSDEELDVVGRSAYPWGLDPQLPILDIAWWNTRELIHHGADISVVRDLYRQLSRSAGESSP